MPKTCPVCATVYPDSDAFCPKDGTTLRMDEAGATLVGSVIADRYLVSKLLGEGGMGQVYLAGHVRLPQQAAIKVLHASMVKDSAAVARFNREAANAARIEHERVARVFDFGETADGLVYLAMEFVPGKTLRDLLDEAGRLPVTRAANIVYQIAEGLDAAHKISIVHRDLKPDNVLVITDEKGVDRCKVVDFGIAKAFDDSDSKKTQLTQAGAIIGTPEFMSPEQVLGEQLDARSDVYALAVVAYHLFTGELPFAATTPERSLTARLISDPQTLHDTAPDLDWPEPLQAAFDRALSREPDTRTGTALEFAEAVVLAVEGWTGAGVLRGRTPLSTSSIGSPTSSTGGAARATTSGTRQAVPEPAAKGSRAPLLVGGLLVVIAAAAGVFAMTRGGGDATGAPSVAMADSTGPGVGAGREADAKAPESENAEDPAGRATTNPAPVGDLSAPQVRDLPINVPINAAANAPKTEPNTAPNSAGATDPAAAAAARKTMDSVATAFANSPEDAPPTFYSNAAAAIDRLLPRLTTRADSAQAYLNNAIIYNSLGDAVRTCTAYRAFNRSATTSAQTDMLLQLQNNPAFSQCR